MNTSFWGWLIGAGVVAGALLLFLGMPGVPAIESPGIGAEQAAVEQVVDGSSSDTPESAHWEPVTTARVAQPTPAVPCSDCGITHTIVQQPERPMVSGCVSTAPRPPCGTTPCHPLSVPCCNPDPCMPSCVVERPGINRHLELCVEECTYIQLHSTVAHPICSDIRFAWSASKGSFLDPASSDPMFFAPTTRFEGGEDVWIVLTITGPDGMRYTDQIQVHVMNRQ